MDKIIKAKLVLPTYLTVEARELIRNVNEISQIFSMVHKQRINYLLVTEKTSQSSIRQWTRRC